MVSPGKPRPPPRPRPEGGAATAEGQGADESRQLKHAHAEPLDFWANEKEALHAMFFNKMNFLLIFVPIGLAARPMGLNSAMVFGSNFLAIIPLSSLLGGSTEAVAHHTGQLVGGLLSATFGNAVEMIMCMQAVRAGLVRVVQGNLLGSVLSNLLLVLGMAIVAGGIRQRTLKFNAEGASANMICQVVASISVTLPTLFGAVKGTTPDEVLQLSRICSVCVAFVYFMFLNFQLRTHAKYFEEDPADAAKGAVEEEAPEAVLSLKSATGLLLIITLIVAGSSEGLVDSIEGVSEKYGLPKAFIGVILLPIVGNAAEHSTAVTSAYKGKMDLALGVAVGSSTQIALFVVPIAVLSGWLFDTPMTLNFRMFDTACQLLSVLLVAQVLQHGNTNWLHGAMLMTTYILIAIMSWFIPEID
eukprot:TRINITY_DN48913_c0_g1_i1.p1 TRINITY_DN48913_c0_g1~~TRINITY_DN48913_c0_g1_i1.p1  ORF type:complete len:415 (-),score=76.36 TRINITY_DN48913_c0_g1_i1:97-1341(-)